MRRVLLLCSAVLGLLLVSSPASAGTTRAMRYADILRATGGTVTVPPEWDGVWSSIDSVFTCEGVFQSTETYLDTLCAGQVFGYTSEGGVPGVFFNCTGEATATTASVDCSGFTEIFPDCSVTISNSFAANRTGDSFVAIAVTNIVYAGTAEGCDLVPDECTRTFTHATRISPAPLEYCVTPTRSSTWGQLKVRYK